MVNELINVTNVLLFSMTLVIFAIGGMIYRELSNIRTIMENN